MNIGRATTKDIQDIVVLVNAAYRGEGGWANESYLIDGPRTKAEDADELLQGPDGVILTARDKESR